MLADVKFFDLLMNVQNTQVEILAHCGGVQLLIVECKLLSVILIAAQLMQPFSALSATQSGIFLTKRTSSLGCFRGTLLLCLAEQLFRQDAFWDSPLLPGLLLFLFKIEYDSCRLSLHGYRTCKQPHQKAYAKTSSTTIF